MRRRTCMWLGGTLGAMFWGIAAFLLGEYVIPATDAKSVFGSADATGAFFGWVGGLGGAIGGARLGASYHRGKRKAREAAARRKHYAEQIAQHEADKAAAPDDDWDAEDRMPLKWKGDKSDDFESPWP